MPKHDSIAKYLARWPSQKRFMASIEKSKYAMTLDEQKAEAVFAVSEDGCVLLEMAESVEQTFAAYSKGIIFSTKATKLSISLTFKKDREVTVQATVLFAKGRMLLATLKIGYVKHSISSLKSLNACGSIRKLLRNIRHCGAKELRIANDDEK